MIWIDNIYDLQYYNQPKTAQCYCEALVFPNDMQLQGHMYNGNGSYALKIYVCSADGMTQYEDATSYFEQYFGVIPNSDIHFFNARLKTWSPAMCAHACFILRAVVTSGGTTYFDKFTERYCISDCCDVARGITVNQSGLIPSPTAPSGGGTAIPTLPSAPSVPTSECGEPLIRIISKFDCIDNFTGDFYGTPDTVLSGSATFEYTKISNLRGRVVRRPREIKREFSYNCRLQRTESKPVYLLEGFEYFPAWKMYEIEGQLHANHIYVDDYKTFKEYQFAGGTAFRQISNCAEVFKLETSMEDCTQRQVFGCGADCKTGNYDGSAAMFAIPESYMGGSFYDENSLLIAEDYDGLLTFFRSKDGVTAVNDIDVATLSCVLYKAFSVAGTGYIPTSFYIDRPIGANKIFSKRAASEEELCEGTAIACKKPVTGTVTISTMTCASPVTGTPVIDSMFAVSVSATTYGQWAITEASGTVYNRKVQLNIEAHNATIIPVVLGEPVYLAGEVIAVVSTNARPTAPVILDQTNNPGMPEGLTVMIDTKGLIYITGNATEAAAEGTTMQLNNLIYSI